MPTNPDPGSLPESPAIRVEGLRFEYPGGEYRLEIDALRIDRGRKVGIIGASGSGKTTLLHLMAGILLPESGRVTVHGRATDRLSDRERRELRLREIGLIFQEFELLEHLTVRENVLLPFFLSRGLGKPDVAHVESITTRAGIHRYLGRRPRRLSQGERQRVAICRALATRPAVLLADEPTGNLDPVTTAHVLDTVFDEAERQRATLVVVTHDHSILDRFDEVIDLESSRGAA
ncbi:MAG: ATP-binding cassette domain-containing protein [Planctomycetes bacterium]|nr:ATP-binding cassette domain-containing protein [Planctomycetota bacterium]